MAHGNSFEIAGIPSGVLRSTIHDALSAYSDMTGRQIEFKPDTAGALIMVEHKELRARQAVSNSPVSHLGEIAGVLTVVVLAHDDNTGLRNTNADYKRSDRSTSQRVIIPKPRTGVLNEAHLTIATIPVKKRGTKPLLFVGSLNTFGSVADSDGIRRTGTLGQSHEDYVRSVQRRQDHVPTVTLAPRTFTASPPVINLEGAGLVEGEGLRPSVSPYAAHNPHPEVQIGAFVTITAQTMPKHRGMLELLAEA